jgi:hypothetical protein
MSVFAERFLLPLFVAVVGAFLFANVFKLDWTYRIGVAIAVFGLGIIVGHWIETSRANKPTAVAAPSPSTQAQSEQQVPPAAPTKEHRMPDDKEKSPATNVIEGHVKRGHGGDGLGGIGGDGGKVGIRPPGPIHIKGDITGGAGGNATPGGKGGKGGDVHVQPEQAPPGQKGHDVIIQPKPGQDLHITGGQGGGISVGNVNVSNNSAPAQVNIGSPGAKQIINPRRVLKPNVRLERGERDGHQILRVLFDQTEGMWNPGELFSVDVTFNGPYIRAKVISGLQGALAGVETTEGNPNAPAAGRYIMKTTTPPISGLPVVLEVESAQELTVTDVKASPTQ